MDPNDIDISSAVSPQREMGAYEWLWLDHTVNTFKQIHERLAQKGAAYPSELVPPDKCEETYQRVKKIMADRGISSFGVRIRDTADYPEKLRDAEYPLAFFYYQGCWDLVFSRSVAVIGTRKPSEMGLKRTAKLVRWLVSKDITVVSGLAEGIDTIAHKTALESGGKTIAVIGTPLSESYPAQNADLQRHIAEKFLVISQVPVCRYAQQTPKFNRFFFPERNKTMSALTEASIIVEASETSGTLIQARAALNQGRKLLVLNSCFENPALTWPARFEKEGAIRVNDVEDVERVLFPKGTAQ